MDYKEKSDEIIHKANWKLGRGKKQQSAKVRRLIASAHLQFQHGNETF